jgi:hypothetical protein
MDIWRFIPLYPLDFERIEELMHCLIHDKAGTRRLMI